MQKQANFNYRPTTGSRRPFSSRMRFGFQSFFLRLLFVVSLLVCLVSPVLASESCDTEGDVTIAYKGIMCAFQPYTITFNGAQVHGPGDTCVMIAASTPKTFTKLKLNTLYKMTASSAICITTINFQVPPGYALYINGVESNQIYKTDAFGSIFSGDGEWDIVVRKDCDCAPNQISVGSSSVGSVAWQAGMGMLTDGRSAYSLSIREKTLSAAIYTPSALIYTPPGLTNEVDVVTNSNGSLRQVKAPQGLADIVAVNASEYDVRYYSPASIGAKSNGIYGLSGQPFVTWKFKNPDPSSFNKLLIQKIENGSVVDQNEYSWESITDSWSLSTGWNSTSSSYSRFDSSSVSRPSSGMRTVTKLVKNSGGQFASRSAKTYQAFTWGEELVQETEHAEASPLTTTYSFHTDLSKDGSYGQLKSVKKPDGSWEMYDYNDLDWTISRVLRPWKDRTLETATPENSRATLYQYARHDGFQIFPYYKFVSAVQEQIGGTVVSNQTFTRWSAVGGVPITINGQPVVREEERDYASESLSQVTTTTRYLKTATQFLVNRIADVEYSDGRKDTYTYEKGNYVPNIDPSLSQFTPNSNGLAERVTVTHGTVASPEGIAFKTIRETIVRNQNGREVLTETYIYTGTGYDRAGWTASLYNDRGQLTQTISHNGETSTATWAEDRRLSETDALGVETVFTYDELGRVKTSTKKGIAAGSGFPSQSDVVTTLTYDAMGRETQKTVTGSSLTLTTTRVFDRAGRVTSEIDPRGLITTYSYTNEGRRQTITRPGGQKEIIEKFRDGRTKSVTGTSVVAQYFDYIVNADGSRTRQEFVGDAGLNSPRWTKITIDWLGRTIKLEEPSFIGTNLAQNFNYDNKGQLTSRVTMAGQNKVLADELFEYDELGKKTRFGSDIDNSGTLTLASMDRIIEVNGIYEKVGSDLFYVTSIQSYLIANEATPTIQTRRARLNNFPLNGSEQTVSEIVATGIAGDTTATTTTINRAAKKTTTTQDTQQSDVNAVSISVNGLLQSSNPAVAQSATIYSYDSLARPTAMVDSRTGTTSFSYSSSTGQVTSMSDNSGTNTFEYYPAAHQHAGRIRTRTNGAGKKTYFNYGNRGEVVQIWGEATYPIEYIYDAYGQNIETHTFRGGNWTGSAWPTTPPTADATKWIYQESTGLVTQKQDTALKGAVYTYDELGRMKTRVWARTITCNYVYDSLTGELRNITYSDNTPAVSFTYDRGGRQTGVTDAAGSHSLTFNPAGELQTEQISGGILDDVGLSVGYDSFLRRSSLQVSQGATTLSNQTYGYDSNSRLSTITSNSQTATHSYYPLTGLLHTTTFTGGSNVARSYDGFGQIQSITTTPSADVAQSFTYTYNLNQRTRLTREDQSYWAYGYNDRQEVISGKKYWADNSIVWGAQTEYSFDNIGNRTAAKNGGNQLSVLRQATYTSNSLNQSSQQSVPGAFDVAGAANNAAAVTVNNQNAVRKGNYFYKEVAVDNSAAPVYPQINVVGARNNFGAGGEDAVTEKGGRAFVAAATETFAFDDDGNLLSDGRWTYTWDAENRLVSMEARPNVPAEAKLKLEFSYDAVGRRIQKKVYQWNSSTSTYELRSIVKFVYDGWNLVDELTSTGTLVRNYVWGMDASGSLQRAGGVGGLLFIHAGGETYIAGFDGSGNVTSMIKQSTGTLSASYEYDPFGNVLKSVGDYASVNPVRFSTKYTDEETGLSYYGYRYYEARTGRWISRDPIEEDGGPNLYAFVSNNPVNNFDARGLYELDVHYYLTYYLAKKVGCFSDKMAQKIAFYTQEVDDDVDDPNDPNDVFTAPGRGVTPQQRKVNEIYHALHGNDHQPYLDYHRNNALAAAEYGNYRFIGQYLHYFQDTYSHAGATNSKTGHAFRYGDYILPPLHIVDKTNHKPQRSMQMARDTFAELKRFAWDLCRCKGSDDMSWEDEVQRFVDVPGGDIVTERLYSIEEQYSSPGGLPRKYFNAVPGELPWLDIKRNILGLPEKPPRNLQPR